MWYAFILSNIGYLGICIEVIWNYQPLFFVIIKGYGLYSNFICISSILNTKFENLIAAAIIVGACIASQLALAFYTSTGAESIFSSSVSDLS